MQKQRENKTKQCEQKSSSITIKVCNNIKNTRFKEHAAITATMKTT